MKDQYVVVTAISTFRHRYVVPLDELLSPEWALDYVTCKEVEEFSQYHMGEQISDYEVLNEEDLLKLFDKDNAYLADWSREQKINHIRNWRETWSSTE